MSKLIQAILLGSSGICARRPEARALFVLILASGLAPNVFQLLTLRPPKRTNLSNSEGSSAGAMWVSGMSEASEANPDEGAEPCEATEELQLRG